MKKLSIVLGLLIFCLFSCKNINQNNNNDMILSVSAPMNNNRSARASYYEESDCEKYLICVSKKDSEEIIISDYLYADGNITFHLEEEGDYIIKIYAYNSKNIEIGKGEQLYTFKYGDTVDVIINIKPNEVGFDIVLVDKLSIVWEKPQDKKLKNGDFKKIKEISKDYEVGDILCDYEGNAFAIVAGKINDYWFALSIYESEYVVWQTMKIKGYDDRIPNIQACLPNTMISDLYCDYIEDYDGSDNAEEIMKFYNLESESLIDYFPPLYYAQVYNENYSELSDLMNSPYYVPTSWEYYTMFENQNIINKSLDSIGGQQLKGKYWTSSQNPKRIETDIANFNFGKWETNQSSNRYDEAFKVRIIFKLK